MIKETASCDVYSLHKLKVRFSMQYKSANAFLFFVRIAELVMYESACAP